MYQLLRMQGESQKGLFLAVLGAVPGSPIGFIVLHIVSQSCNQQIFYSFKSLYNILGLLCVILSALQIDVTDLQC